MFIKCHQCKVQNPASLPIRKLKFKMMGLNISYNICIGRKQSKGESSDAIPEYFPFRHQ